MKKLLCAFALFASMGVAFAQTSGQITSGSQSTTTGSVSNTITFPTASSGQNVNYDGSYSVKSAPPVYAPNLTNSMTETCLGSVSGGVSFMGGGVTLGKTVEDLSCQRRLDAAVAGRMGRMDVAFNIMCQSPQFYEAAKGTDKPCTIPEPVKSAEVKQIEQDMKNPDPIVRYNNGLPPLSSIGTNYQH